MELLYLLAIASLASASPLLQTRQDQICNGHAEFCSRKYSNVSLVGTHDAPFVGAIVDPRINQQRSVAEQLDAGIRFLTGQTHVVNTTTATEDLGRDLELIGEETFGTVKEIGDDVGDALGGLFGRETVQELHLCHTSCVELDSGRLYDFLNTIKTFLDGNPNEVITLLLTNGDRVDVSLFGDVFSSIAGLTDYAFVPSTSPAKLEMDAWPTYGELIQSGKRLVVFLDYDADQTKVSYILDEFTYFFETPFDTTDPEFPQCSIDRPPNTPNADGRMSIINHYLDRELLPGILIPDNGADYTTNAATGNGSIGAQADLCSSMYGRPPNVVLVDMFDRGDVFTAQNHLNGL